jgi:phenylpropionate dioxygenase-like ring-hydroxylating dioxygenase large terminal subunit
MNASLVNAPEDRFAFLGTGPVPVEPYISQDYFEREREAIFRAEWLNVAREEELPNPGDFVVREIEVCNASIIVARGEDGVIRAFHNICSHRGNRLVFADKGSGNAFTCRYHGWSYTLEGAVKTITARERFRGLDPAACALPAVHCDTWRGFVFVNLAAQPRQTLREFLGGWGEFANSYPFERCTARVDMRFTLNANWKVALDAFQETYHLGYLHLRTMRNMYFTPRDHSGSFLSADLFGPHRRFSIWANPEHRVPESARVEHIARRYGRNINAGSQAGSTTAASITEICPGLNPTRDPKWAWDNAFVFPNMVVTFAAELWIVSRFWPLAQDRTRWENFTYYPKPVTASERFSREQGVAHLRDVAAEDVDTMEGTTRALKSRARQWLNISDNEIGVRHMQLTVDRYLKGEAPVTERAHG